MDIKYYIAVGNKPEGPYSPEELLNHGLKMDSLVWSEGMADWIQAGKVPELAELLFSRTPGQCPPPLRTSTPPATDYSGYRQYQAPQSMPCPKTWLLPSVLATLFCCIPFGIVGIIKASNVQSLWARGLYDESVKASRAAATWTAVAFFTGVAGWLIYLVCSLLPLMMVASDVPSGII